MKKRQKKKNHKKYLPILPDEANLLTMTDEEYAKEWNDYLKFREQHAFCKTYKKLKYFQKKNKRKMIFYQFPVGTKFAEQMRSLSNIGRLTK